jgi:hypothetical protein
MILTGQLLQCLGLLLFAAHAWRCGSPGLAAACLGLIVVVFSRHKATPYLLGRPFWAWPSFSRPPPGICFSSG